MDVGQILLAEGIDSGDQLIGDLGPLVAAVIA